MKEIIPLKKDIIFKTKIGEITNIDLDLDYKINNDLIDGNVLLSGNYKMTEASVIEEDFFYKIPFVVSLSKKVNKDTIKIEIDDFNYNISKDILSTKIDLEFTCDEVKENKEELKNDDELIKEYFDNSNELENENLVENNIEDNTIVNEEKTKIDLDENINNITNNFINNENKYYTYKVYIVRDGDNIESICNKYNISLNDIKEYNDVSEIKTGDKIIIPQINE